MRPQNPELLAHKQMFLGRLIGDQDYKTRQVCPTIDGMFSSVR
jgi:hypothetical protein